MPIYPYRCQVCGVFEIYQPIKAEPFKWCPNCSWIGSLVNRLLNRKVTRLIDFSSIGVRPDYFSQHPYWSDNLSPDGINMVYVDSNKKYREFKKKAGLYGREGRMNKDSRVIQNSKDQLDQIKQRGDEAPRWLVNQAAESREY